MREGPAIALDESTKEVFSQIGVTLFAAQAFEACLNGMLTGLYVNENPLNWRKNYEAETKKLDTLSLGKLLDRARKAVSFSTEVDSLLNLALKRRNYFIHHFYTESFGLMTDLRGREKLIQNLKELQRLFRKADDLIEPISYQLMRKAGITREQTLMLAHQAVQSQLSDAQLGE